MHLGCFGAYRQTIERNASQNHSICSGLYMYFDSPTVHLGGIAKHASPFSCTKIAAAQPACARRCTRVFHSQTTLQTLLYLLWLFNCVPLAGCRSTGSQLESLCVSFQRKRRSQSLLTWPPLQSRVRRVRYSPALLLLFLLPPPLLPLSRTLLC